MRKFFGIYARQSIDKSDSISIETQIERCIFEVGDNPYRVYSDRGYSGKNTDRPQFKQLLDDLLKGEIACVVCYKLDRCSRSILDFTQLMNLFQQHDVSFISCTEKFDTATPMGRAMLNICIVFAQLERETIQQRITDAYHSRCRKGYFMGGRVPFGYCLVPYCLDGKKTSCYHGVPEEAGILEKIFEIYSNPHASLSDVVQRLQSAGIANPRRTDGMWVRTHIAKIIKNPIYVMADGRIYDYYAGLNTIPDNPREDYTGYNGCYLYHIENEQHLVLAPHRGIISADLWLLCQRNRPAAKSRKNGSGPASWLTGLLTCQKCGRAVATRKTVGKNGVVYRYFLCSAGGRENRFCNPFKPFSASLLEEAVKEAIIRHLQTLFSRQNSSAQSLLRQVLDQLNCTCGTTESIRNQLKLIFEQLPPHTAGYGGDFRCIPEPDNRQNSLLEHFSRWEEIPLRKKARIARLLIDTVKLTDGRASIIWRI